MSRTRMGLTPLHAFRKTAAILGVALAMAVASYFLPSNAYQRWRLLDGTDYATLRRIYERIHFDPKPVDVVIVGPSKTLNGLSEREIQERLSALGKPGNVANFSVVADGRNLDWAVIDELFKTKTPKAIVISVDDRPYPYGHPAFKFFAPPEDIVLAPSPFLHDYLYDLGYLPFRQLKLLGARLFPAIANLDGTFDPERYAREPTDLTSGFFAADGKWVDVNQEVSPDTLRAQSREHPELPPSRGARFLSRLGGDYDRAYLDKIAALAKAHGTKLVFLYLPSFEGPSEIANRAFLEQYGQVLNFGDLANDHKLFMNWGHLNHAGAMIASDRLADAISAIEP